jgi:hypothetical protein
LSTSVKIRTCDCHAGKLFDMVIKFEMNTVEKDFNSKGTLLKRNLFQIEYSLKLQLRSMGIQFEGNLVRKEISSKEIISERI